MDGLTAAILESTVCHEVDDLFKNKTQNLLSLIFPII